jgi:hypothetical protein
MIRGRWLSILLLTAILPSGGCAPSRLGLPWNHSDPDLAAMAGDSAAYFPDTTAVADSHYPLDYAQETTTIVEPAHVRREPPPPAVVTPAEPDAPPGETSTPPPTISVAIPEPERTRLADAFRLDVAVADSLRTELSYRVTSAQGKEKLQTAADLLTQARAAMEAQNVEAAANLAHKARLLVQELIPR